MGAQAKRWHLGNVSREVAKVSHLVWALEHTINVPGDVVECGVGAGGSLAVLKRNLTGSSKLVAIDTFSGFPNGGLHDSSDFDPKGRWAVYEKFGVSFVRSNLLRAGLTPDQVADILFVEGDVSSALSTSTHAIRLLHLDLDIYQSYSNALEAGWDRLQVGGLVLLDEYDKPSDLKKWPGAKKAIDEFVREKRLEIFRHSSGFWHLKKDSA